MKHVVPIALLLLCAALRAASAAPEYSIVAIRLANSPGDRVAEMVTGAPPDENIDTIYAMWLIRGGGRNILFDSGFHRARWFKEWTPGLSAAGRSGEARGRATRRDHGHRDQPRALGSYGWN